jgi:hypothetical protein
MTRLLLEVIQIANFLDIPGLLELSAAQFASIYLKLKRDKEAVRRAFGIAQPDHSKQAAVEEKSGGEGRRGSIGPHSMEDKKMG